MRGDRKGFEGKVSKVDRAKYRIFVEGVTRTKVDGSTVPISVHPSKTMITNLDLDDKWRKKILERKGRMPTEKEAKPPKEVVVSEKEEAKEARIEEAEKPKVKEKTRKPRRKKKEIAEPAQEKAKKTKKTAKAEAKPRRRRTKKTSVEKGEE
jgi:ribosomal protein L24